MRRVCLELRVATFFDLSFGSAGKLLMSTPLPIGVTPGNVGKLAGSGSPPAVGTSRGIRLEPRALRSQVNS
jgi:hypothetical protein